MASAKLHWSKRWLMCCASSNAAKRGSSLIRPADRSTSCGIGVSRLSPDYSILMPADLTTLAHFSTSALMKAANTRAFGQGSAPIEKRRRPRIRCAQPSGSNGKTASSAVCAGTQCCLDALVAMIDTNAWRRVDERNLPARQIQPPDVVDGAPHFGRDPFDHGFVCGAISSLCFALVGESNRQRVRHFPASSRGSRSPLPNGTAVDFAMHVDRISHCVLRY